MAAIAVSMEQFTYTSESAHEAWLMYKLRFANYLLINDLDVTNNAQAATAKALLLHSGGIKIIEVYTAIHNAAALTYAQLITVLDNRFLLANDRLATLRLRHARQEEKETFDDYVTRLTRMAIAAGVAEPARAAEIVNIIAQNARDPEVQNKAWAVDTTLDNLKTWVRNREIQSACLQMSNSQNKQVNAVREATPNREREKGKQCYRCGTFNFPHQNGTRCPAIGATCNLCGKLDHYERICMQHEQNRPTRQNSFQSTRGRDSNDRNQNYNNRDRSNPRAFSRDRNDRTNDRQYYNSGNERRVAIERTNERNDRRQSSPGNEPNRRVYRIDDDYEQYQKWRKAQSEDKPSDTDKETRKNQPQARREQSNRDNDDNETTTYYFNNNE